MEIFTLEIWLSILASYVCPTAYEECLKLAVYSIDCITNAAFLAKSVSRKSTVSPLQKQAPLLLCTHHTSGNPVISIFCHPDFRVKKHLTKSTILEVRHLKTTDSLLRFAFY